jgi:hypothetical protein
MSELIVICVEEEKRINTEKSIFAHAVIDGLKVKIKLKSMVKIKIRQIWILMLTKQVRLVQNILLSVIIARNMDT